MLKKGASLQALKDHPSIRFLPLKSAIRYAQQNPQQVDQMTQVQLYLLSLKEGLGFTFNK